MTPTRYMADLLKTTNEHVAEYLAALEAAEKAGKSRATVINFHFDLLSLDFELRLNQTIGTARALVEVAKATPRTPAGTRANALLRRTFSDFDYIATRMSDRDLRRGRRGNDHNTVCDDCTRRGEASSALWRKFAAEMAELPPSSALRLAGCDVLRRILLGDDCIVLSNLRLIGRIGGVRLSGLDSPNG